MYQYAFGSDMIFASKDFVTDKRLSVNSYKVYMINRLHQMFLYKNLPKTIPQYILEQMLMLNGSAYITKVDGKLYAFTGTFGGEPDVYYRPTKYVIANPALKFSKTLDLFNLDSTVTDDGAFIRNDVLWYGLNPLLSRYATLLAENVVTLRMADVMLRVVAMLSAPDDKTKLAADKYLKDLEDGKLGVIGENRFFEGINMQSPPSNNGSYLTQFIELQQYYKGSFFNEIGISAPYNMKRESINESEASLNEDTLLPLIDTMYDCRKNDIKRLNELFDLDIEVSFNSIWLQNRIEDKISLLRMVKESDSDNETSQLAEESQQEESEEISQLTEEVSRQEETEETSQLVEDSQQKESEETSQLTEEVPQQEESEETSQLAEIEEILEEEIVDMLKEGEEESGL